MQTSKFIILHYIDFIDFISFTQRNGNQDDNIIYNEDYHYLKEKRLIRLAFNYIAFFVALSKFENIGANDDDEDVNDEDEVNFK